MHEGHRQRILERVENGDKLQDHELIEILLFNPIVRKNTNEIAHALLDRFGGLKNMFQASAEELQAVDGVGKSTALYIRTIAQLYLRVSEKTCDLPSMYNYHSFSGYVATRYANVEEEYLDLFCLDNQFHITYNVRFGTHQSDRVQVSLDEVNRALTSHHPSGIVISHNHPFSTARPSLEDKLFTDRVKTLCSLYKVRLYDHIIVGTDGTYSFFQSGELNDQDDVTGSGRF